MLGAPSLVILVAKWFPSAPAVTSGGLGAARPRSAERGSASGYFGPARSPDDGRCNLPGRLSSEGLESAWAPDRAIHSQPARDPQGARQFFGAGGWTLGTRSMRAETFSYNLRPAGPEVVVLLLLGVLPGLAYLVAGKRRVTVSVAADADADGSATLVSWSNSGECEQTCRDFASMIRSQEPRRSDARPRGRIQRRRSVRSGFAEG